MRAELRLETGLDYFGARYFSGAQGRFTSPDWSEIPQAVPYADLTDPQTLNLYAYERNNPLSKPDLDGHGCPPDCSLLSRVKAVASNPYVQGAGKIAVGVGLILTVAGGDVPGGVAGAVLVANTALGGTVSAVSGTAQILGAATNTNTKEAQEVLGATSTLPGLVTAAAGGNLKAAETVTTVTNAATLAVAPKEAVKNIATAADAAQTVKDSGGLISNTINAVKNFFSPPPPPPPTPPSACSGTGTCR